MMTKDQAQEILEPFASDEYIAIREFVRHGYAFTPFFQEVEALRWAHTRDRNSEVTDRLKDVWQWMRITYPGSYELWEHDTQENAG